MFLRGLGICADVVKELVPEMKVTDVGEPVYAELFRKVIAENPVYASGPFRVTLRDADLAKLLEPLLAGKGFRDLSVACQPGVIHAQATYPLTRFALGEPWILTPGSTSMNTSSKARPSAFGVTSTLAAG